MNFTDKAQIARMATLASAMILIGLYWSGHIIGGQDVLLRCIVSALPIALFFPGILARKYRSGSFLCFVLLIYFMFACQSLFIPGGLWHDIAIISMIVILFTIAMFYARWQQRANVFEGDAEDG